MDQIISKLQVLEFNAASMRLYARIFDHLRTLGQIPGVMDMLIAPVSLSYNQRFLTRNAAHFAHVPGLWIDSY